MTIMYALADLCCICLKRKNQLRQLLNSYENINYYSKLVLLFPEVVSIVLSNQGSICPECCSNVDSFYKFREECLRNIQAYINYTFQLCSVSEISGEVFNDLTNAAEEQKELLKDCELSEKQCSSTDILPGCNKTYCRINETSEKNYSTLETGTKEYGTRDGATDDVHHDNTSSNITCIEEVNIKSEPADTIKCEEDKLENSTVTKTESRDPLEAYGTSSTEDASQCNYNTNIIDTEGINIKSEHKDDSEYEESAAGKDTGSATSSTKPDVNCESLTNNKCIHPTTIWPSHLDSLKKIDSGKKRFKCEQCTKTFTRSSDLIIHKRGHSGDKPFKCDQCDRSFVKSSPLITHKRVHSGEKPFKCDQCDKAFSQSSNLINHKRLHSGEKPFKCDQCDKAFSQLSNLTKHKRMHSGEKPFKCEQCNKEFSDPSTLIKHKRTHSGEKPFKCEQCNKAFTESSSLTKHNLLHSGEKPFKCDQCNRGYLDASSLTKHKRRHTGEKPFKCGQCNKAFTESSSLIKHKRIHSRERPF